MIYCLHKRHLHGFQNIEAVRHVDLGVRPIIVQYRGTPGKSIFILAQPLPPKKTPHANEQEKKYVTQEYIEHII